MVSIDTRLPHSKFDVNGLPDAEKFAAWRESISTVFEVEADKQTRNNGSFYASLSAFMHGGHMLVQTSSVTQHWKRSDEIIGRDGMDHYMIQLYQYGSMRYTHRNVQREVNAGDLIIFDNAQSMSIATSDMTTLTLIVLRADLAPLLNKPDDQHLRHITMNEPAALMLRNHLLLMHELSASFTLSQAVSLNPASLALVAACLNAPDETLGENSAIRVAKAVVVRRFVIQNLSNPLLSPEFIVQSLGMSRSTLYKLFEELGGVAKFIRDQRLRRVRMILADPTHDHKQMKEICKELGFSNDSAFSRRFKQRYGMSASDYRRDGRNTFPDKSIREGMDRRWKDWVRILSD
ncbi:MAG: helix-turn-helix domain-containing protein [Nitratireductor sp.]|uniref:helix-turn-helix domain-containing protein n=1 Tax=Nitratireductor sp. TaxID=1872084 RepID=UPI002628ADCF|nr:helix-turn-helix domain-containing protein [Nitratireductor sp.]MCV0351408.1 helix-turn-helix domain-containing protein [Nitratireductor sp.]